MERMEQFPGLKNLKNQHLGEKQYKENITHAQDEYDWGVSQRFRFETFCYGPKNCVFYKMGKPRAVPYKGDDSAYDDGCLDEILTDFRSDEE